MTSETTGTTRDVARLADGAEVRRRCARSTARRLLGGAGVIDVVAYRWASQPALAPLAHGLTAAGDWLVAVPEARLPVGASGLPERMEVRVSIEQLGAPSDLRVQIASLHALGTLRLLSAEESSRLLDTGTESEPLHAAAQAPGAVLGLLSTETVLVHARDDVEKLPWSAVVDGGAFPAPGREWDALDVAAALDDAAVRRLLEELVDGSRRGIIGRPVAAPQEQLAAPVLLDVDAEGCTWLVRSGDQVRSVVLAFDRPVQGMAELQEALRAWRATA
ncbi:hypothetical protein [Nesterenkonia sp. F]|uniref:hypothetical protein n=1 Tax=Nesterenkonia sp. F TaxID=795955 RepID=UPI000255D784|nr:hypothetical protein [Nesterenkonia sp. F]